MDPAEKMPSLRRVDLPWRVSDRPAASHSLGLTPGEMLDGKYSILDKIGEGGMGEVYRARHVHLDEIRFIKVTKPGALADDADPRRFQEEVRIATLVRHPNVAALYDFSRQPDGSYYMVWEFIDGVTLEDRGEGRSPDRDYFSGSRSERTL